MIIGRTFFQTRHSLTSPSLTKLGPGAQLSNRSYIATCFFLGILFASFPYDFPLLWSKEPVPTSYYDQLETHLKFIHQSPPLIGRMLNIIVSVGFLGMFIKLFKPSEANFLFDGASLILYTTGVAVYISNIVKGLRTVSSGFWDSEEFKKAANLAEGEIILDREDSLRVLSASNTILALVLIGVLVLQAGQWYAEKRDRDDEAALAVKEAPAAKSATKKKQ